MNQQLKGDIEQIIGPIHERSRLAEQGCTSEVSQVMTDKGSFLLKSSFQDKYREWLRTEADVLERLRGEEVPVPRYQGFIEYKDSSHLLMSFEEGVSLSAALENAKSDGARKSLIRAFGRFLLDLHQMKVPSLDSSSVWLDEQLVKAENYAKRGEADGSLEHLQKLKEDKPAPVRQTMIHGDCNTDNILVLENGGLMWIDVAGMAIGDPRYDECLAIRKLRGYSEYIEAFYEGYTRYRVSEDEFTYFNNGLYEFF